MSGIILSRHGGGLEHNQIEKDIVYLFSILVAIYCFGGMLGGLLVGWTADNFGRKGSILLNNVFVVLPVICFFTAYANDWFEAFIVGRFLIGINSGLNAGLVPMYLAEISPTHLRGAVGTVYQLGITISILMSMIIGMETALGTEDLWIYLFYLIVIPAAYQIITLPFCPESPKYTLSKDKDEAAQKGQTMFFLYCFFIFFVGKSYVSITFTIL